MFSGHNLSDLPVELQFLIAKYLRPEDANRLFSTSKQLQKVKTSDYSHPYYRQQLVLHFPFTFKKLDKKTHRDWKKVFINTYQTEYRDLPNTERKLLSIVKTGDLESFIAGKYNLEDLVKVPRGELINRGINFMSWAAINHHQTMLDYFYSLACKYRIDNADHAINPHEIDSLGYALLHYAAFCNQSVDTTILPLIGSGTSINTCAWNDGITALMIAAGNGHLEIVNALLTNGASVDIARWNGVTALMIAAGKGDLEIVEALLGKGASVNAACDDGETALYIAAQKGDLEIVEALLGKGASVDVARWDGKTALYIAAQKGHLEIVEALLGKGASVNATDRYGDTALMIAAENGYLEIVRALLANGASVDVAQRGVTALMIAAGKGHLEIVQALTAKGARLDDARIARLTQHYGQNEVANSTNILFELNKSQLSDYIIQRGADNAPDYKTTFTLFGKTLHFGFSKQEKLAAAIMLKCVLEGADPAALDQHEKALNNGELGRIYQVLKNSIPAQQTMLSPSKGGA